MIFNMLNSYFRVLDANSMEWKDENNCRESLLQMIDNNNGGGVVSSSNLLRYVLGKRENYSNIHFVSLQPYIAETNLSKVVTRSYTRLFYHAVTLMKESMLRCHSYSNGVCSSNLYYHDIAPDDVGGAGKIWDSASVFPCIVACVIIFKNISVRMWFRESGCQTLFKKK